MQILVHFDECILFYSRIEMLYLKNYEKFTVTIISISKQMD